MPAGLTAPLLLACAGSPAAHEGPAPPSVPSISEVAVSCSRQEDSWTTEVLAAGWTAGGLLAWTADDLYLEEHPLPSVEADADGWWDHLLLELPIAADPADAGRGYATAMLCDAATRESLAWRVAVYVPGTEDEGDCRTGGRHLDWEGLGYEPCGDP